MQNLNIKPTAGKAMNENNIKFEKTKMLRDDCHFALEKMKKSKELTSNAKLKKFESYFTEYILIVFHREFEEKLKHILQKALEKYAGPKAAELIKRIKDPLFKRISLEDIKKTVGYFGPKKKERFKSSLEKIDRKDQQQYKNFINNRHSVAHSLGNISISWGETEKIDETGTKILKAVCISLKL